MRILILTIYHDPDPIPKTGELARELQRRGHTVHVVTSLPHYPTGRLHPGYRLALWRREVRQGVPVLRTFVYPYHGDVAWRRIVNYVSWMFSSMLAAVLTPACDVIYVWHPPLTVGVTAWVLSKLKRAPFVYDVQDLWPESALASGMMRPGRLVRFLDRLADWVYARAPRILVVSAAAAQRLKDRGVDPAKIIVAKHWIDESLYAAKPAGRNVRRELGLGDRFVVMFAGNLGAVQGLETVVEAARLLRDDPRFAFVLVGDGSDRPRLERLVCDAHVTNVIFAGRHPAEVMSDFFASADVLLVHIRPSTIADYAIPTKILAYLAAGRPILCAMPGAAADLVRAADAGVCIAPGDAPRLAWAITELSVADDEWRRVRGENGRSFLWKHFRREAVIGLYEDVLVDVGRAAAAQRA